MTVFDGKGVDELKKAGIFYFSGTGNTELVAEMIKQEFSNLDYAVELTKVEDVLKGKLTVNPDDYDLMGIGCQVIGYSIPNIMYAFMRKLPEAKGTKVFIFRTAGGVAPINYNASNPLIKKLKRKGYEVYHERIFSIGSNWITKFEDSIMARLYEATRNKVAIMCREAAAGQRRILRTGLRLRIGIGIAAPVFSFLIRFIGKDLKASKACSHCGQCVQKCPAGNIYEKGGRIKFRSSCNCCLRCVYSCPGEAIGFKLFSFIPV
ncbi:MAG: 4Fe-4S ferredoxin, partial [Eubacterium sp.]|nr:4Fe-4S ferredoxin [Eubacterium sp.]